MRQIPGYGRAPDLDVTRFFLVLPVLALVVFARGQPCRAQAAPPPLSETQPPAPAQPVPPPPTGPPPTTAAQPASTRAPAPPAKLARAPRVYSVTLGPAYAFSNQLPLSDTGDGRRSWGLQVGGRLGWQVRGLDGGNPASVGFETSFLMQPSGHVRDSYALLYGIFAKHSFLVDRRAHPFFSYGLGAAQVWVSEVDGRGIGHVTRLGFGVDIAIRPRLQISVTLTYQGIIMPSFALEGGSAHDTSIHGFVLSTGVWFGS